MTMKKSSDLGDETHWLICIFLEINVHLNFNLLFWSNTKLEKMGWKVLLLPSPKQFFRNHGAQLLVLHTCTSCSPSDAPDQCWWLFVVLPLLPNGCTRSFCWNRWSIIIITQHLFNLFRTEHHQPYHFIQLVCYELMCDGGWSNIFSHLWFLACH